MEKMPESTLLALTIANVRAGFSSPAYELGKLARHDFFFVGGVKRKAEHVPLYRQSHLDFNIGEWVYNVDQSKGATVTITDIGGIAILSALFGNLDTEDERWMENRVLTKKGAPHFAWKETPQLNERAPRVFKYFARPELITEAQMHPENVTGNIHVVRPPLGEIEPIGQGLYNCFVKLETLAVMPLDGISLLHIDVEPDNFDDIPSIYSGIKDKQG